ncbi:hypothetical protein [Corynebacterium provencense]|uniref:hypothetical protein n=1 Tax=Corynebacterium provencense TaxID=1737425 RepID=UPI0011C86C67|nr:hypothetical protein [Corynebacterium provencense]
MTSKSGPVVANTAVADTAHRAPGSTPNCRDDATDTTVITTSGLYAASRSARTTLPGNATDRPSTREATTSTRP